VNKSHKYLKFLMLIALLALFFFPSSNFNNYVAESPKPSQGIDLTIHVNDQRIPGVKNVTADFLASPLGSGVDSVTVLSSGYMADDMYNYYTLLMQSGTATADIIDLDGIWTADFAENEWIIPLDSYLDPNELDDYAPGLVEGCKYKGIYYAYPYYLNLGILYYRKDLMDTHFGVGMWSESDFDTWEKLNQTANYILNNQSGLLTIDDVDLVGYVGQFDAYEGGVVNFFEWCGSNAALNLITSDLEVNINTTEVSNAINFLKGLIAPQSYGVQGTPYIIPRYGLVDDESSSLIKWLANESIFMRQWNFAYQSSQSYNMSFGLAPLPHFAGATGYRTSAVGGSILAIPSATTGIAREAAINFTKFLGDHTAQEAELTADIDDGTPGVQPLSNFPALKSVYLNPPSGFEWIKNWSEQIDLTLSRPVTLDYPTISDIIADYFSDTISCQLTPAEGLSNMQEDISNLFAKYAEIYVDNVKTEYTSESFNFIFYLRDVKDDPIIDASIQAWWNGTDVSSSFLNLGNGNYSVNLTPITLGRGDAPILLNLTISAPGFNDRYYEKFVSVPTPGGPITPRILGYELFILISMSLLSIVIIYIKLKKKSKY
jgi:multiple sugar transport system substrate-binding protein